MAEPKSKENAAKDEKAQADADKKEKEPVKPVKPPLTPTQEIKANLALIERAVSTLEPRYTTRVLRSLTTLRKKLTSEILSQAVREAYTKGCKRIVKYNRDLSNLIYIDGPAKQALLNAIPEPTTSTSTSMEVDPAPPASTNATSKGASPPAPSEPCPEGDVYLRLLVILRLLDANALDKSRTLAHETVDKIKHLNRRSMDPIAAKVYFYLARLYELKGDLAELRPSVLPLALCAVTDYAMH